LIDADVFEEGATPTPGVADVSVESARTYADAGLPASVSASAAFSAYGTLARCARGCSTSPARWNRTPTQRGSLVVNRSSGSPSLDVDPRSRLYRPSALTVTVCVSSHTASPPSRSR